MQTTPSDYLMSVLRDLDEALQMIQSAREEHFDINPDNITWDDVQLVQEIAIELKSICNLLQHEGDYPE